MKGLPGLLPAAVWLLSIVPEFVSVVIELVIGNSSQATHVSIANYSSCFEVKLQLQITVLERYNN